MVKAQQALWYDRIEDALHDCVQALGGPKRVATALWPGKTAADAARYLNHCLDSERAEKLELGQVVTLMRWGRDADCHTPMHYLAETLGYQPPEPKNPETERDRLQREFIQAQEQMATLVKRMERLGGGTHD